MNDLISRQWIIKRLEAEKEYRANRGERGAEKGLCYALEIVDDMPSAQEWISVDERLPKKGQVVLAYGTRSSTTGQFQGIGARPWFWMWKGNTIKRVTHWRPLPEPPKEEEK